MLRDRIRWLVYAVVPLSTGLKRAWNEQDLSSRVYYMISPLVTGLVVYGLSRLPSQVRQLKARPRRARRTGGVA